MGRLLDGKWIAQDVGTDAQGRYVRRETQFRHKFDDDTEYPAPFKITSKDEQGRYVLVAAWACGWCHRVLLVRALMGLENAIPVVFTDAFMGDDGWTFYGHNNSNLKKKDDDVVADGDKKRPAIGGSKKVEETTPLTITTTTTTTTTTMATTANSGGITAQELYLDPASAGYDRDSSNVVVQKVHELYVLAQSDYTGRASVPVLWDRKTGTIVNNESSDLIYMLANDGQQAHNKHISLIPSGLETAIQEMTQANYVAINNGVYRCGFASSQQAYTEAATALFERLEELEALLGRQRYLCSDYQVTMADLCLFPTIYRFDTIYYTHFKCNKKHIYEFPNLWGWTREIYQMPGVAETCNMKECCIHYYTSHESIHPRRYIPLGPTLDFGALHRRDEFAYKA